MFDEHNLDRVAQGIEANVHGQRFIDVEIVMKPPAQREDESVFDAIHEAGLRRFRPIMLTTLTTFGGLSPIIFETSRQATQLGPMAISLGFDIVFATSIILVLVPVSAHRPGGCSLRRYANEDIREVGSECLERI